MRLFLGIPLAPPVVEELAATIQRLRAHGDGLRWSSPESWHVTLQFLGSTSPQQYACVVARLRELHCQSVPVAFEELGFFDRAGIFFAGVQPDSELHALQIRITASTALCGFVAETRPFHPHITLARGKGEGRGQSLRALQDQDSQPA